MNSKIWIPACALACLLGVAVGQWICRSAQFRSRIGRVCGRGELVALTHSCGIYEADLTRAEAEVRFRDGADDPDSSIRLDNAATLGDLLANLALTCLGKENSDKGAVDREYSLLATQILPRKAWLAAVRRNYFLPFLWRGAVADCWRGEARLERQIADTLEPSESACRAYYAAHLDAFNNPARFRASHLFVAAPPETPPSVVEQKHATINDLRKRLERGEKFEVLTASFSEDEATKWRGGDLGFFSEWRMPPDFMAAVKAMKLGTTELVRTGLGFHIIRLNMAEPPRQRSFEESKTEIKSIVANIRRKSFVDQVRSTLGASGQVSRPNGT